MSPAYPEGERRAPRVNACETCGWQTIIHPQSTMKEGPGCELFSQACTKDTMQVWEEPCRQREHCGVSDGLGGQINQQAPPHNQDGFVSKRGHVGKGLHLWLP